MLRENLKQNPEVFSKMKRGLRKLAGDKASVTVGSVCTGWGVGDMVTEALNDVLDEDPADECPKARVCGGGRSVSFYTLCLCGTGPPTWFCLRGCGGKGHDFNRLRAQVSISMFISQTTSKASIIMTCLGKTAHFCNKNKTRKHAGMYKTSKQE